MADVSLRGIPAELHLSLKQAAKRNHRSLNGEILSRLEDSVRETGAEVETLLVRVRDRSRRIGPRCIDDVLLRRLREEGRP